MNRFCEIHNVSSSQKQWSLWLLCLLFASVAAMCSVKGQTDTTKTLSYDEFIENIVLYHPVAKKAELRLAMASAEQLGAKGMMDPKLSADWSEKNFDDKLYYRKYHVKLKLPTRYGVGIVGGYENSEGYYLNPENGTDEFGLWHLGLEADLLQGLLVNERRVALQQAEIFQNLAENERQIILNDLIYDASLAYFMWQQFDYNREVLTKNRTLLNSYFDNTKQSFLGGEKTAMDTLEAFILYQDASVSLQKNAMHLIKAQQSVENYLWYDDLPASLQEESRPQDYSDEIWPVPAFSSPFDLSKHPNVLASLNKLSYLDVTQKLKREKRKPKLKLKYNPLLGTSENSVSPSFSLSDYKWGVDFSMPLLQRSVKADLQRGEIKMRELELDLANKRNELQNKIESSWQNQQLLLEQIALLNENVDGYERLLNGEQVKFNYGESSVFLLNKRNEKYINGELKLIEAFVKHKIELLKFKYYSNTLISD